MATYTQKEWVVVMEGLKSPIYDDPAFANSYYLTTPATTEYNWTKGAEWIGTLYSDDVWRFDDEETMLMFMMVN